MNKKEMDTKAIEDVVKSIFSQKEEAAKQKKAEEALEASAAAIEKLTETVEGKDTEIATLNEKVAEMDTKMEEANTEIATLKSVIDEKAEEMKTVEEEKAAIAEELASVKETLETMEKDKLVAERMEELASAGVAHADAETQAAKVREMATEDFEAYKSELVSIREAVLAELAANKEEAEKEEKEETAAAEGDDDGAVPPPANVEGKESASALNMEADAGKSKFDGFADEFAKLMG